MEDIERAEALLSAGQAAAAIPMLERLAFTDPEHGRVWALLTRALLEAGEYQRAAITSYAFEALAPSPYAYLLRSKALLHVEPHEALTPALAAQAATPHDWEAQAQVSRAHLVGRDATQAGLQAARRAVELAPEVSEAHIVLALALRRHEHFAEAETSAARALSLDPHNREARDLLDGLALMRPRGSAAPSAQTQTTRSRGPVIAVALLVVVVVLATPVVLLVVGSQTAYVCALVVAALMIMLALLQRQRKVR